MTENTQFGSPEWLMEQAAKEQLAIERRRALEHGRAPSIIENRPFEPFLYEESDMTQQTGITLAGPDVQYQISGVSSIAEIELMAKQAVEAHEYARTPEGRAKAAYESQRAVYEQAGVSQEQFLKQFVGEFADNPSAGQQAAAVGTVEAYKSEYAKHRADVFEPAGISEVAYIASRKTEDGHVD